MKGTAIATRPTFTKLSSKTYAATHPRSSSFACKSYISMPKGTQTAWPSIHQRTLKAACFVRIYKFQDPYPRVPSALCYLCFHIATNRYLGYLNILTLNNWLKYHLVTFIDYLKPPFGGTQVYLLHPLLGQWLGLPLHILHLHE